MKKLRLITLTAFAAICMSVSAQEPFATFYGQYNLSYLKSSHDSDSHKENFNEVTLGYNYATPLFSIPSIWSLAEPFNGHSRAKTRQRPISSH